MRTLPEGVVTFLFTDVEGSTRLAKALGDAPWAELLETHRRLLREALGAHGGLEVDTQGDAFFFVFTRATDAAAAATAAQRALERHAWPSEGRVRVRMGLHTGEALARGEHYVGQEVHRTSRICDAGHGGQIVVSQTTAELVGTALPPEATLSALGRYRLKDLDEPHSLFQLGAPDLPSGFARLRSLDAPHNLPAERSSFVGRVEEVAHVERLLGKHRLVTLAGIGGAGKTRLALRVGTQALTRFTDGVFFVDLAAVGDDDLVAPTFANACDLMLDQGENRAAFDDQLVTALARRSCLLLVDNCEHLLDAIGDLVDRLLAASRHLVVLATSREALGIEGEHIVRVASLGLPDDPAGAAGADAVQLFVARATSVKPGFQLDGETGPAIVEICRRLDGIPLAIEFAAARVALLSPAQIAARLEDMFRLLTGGRRRIQRQQTLAATLDWSHNLLDDAEQALFRRLAVFAGPFGLEATEGICADGSVPDTAVLDLLGSLVAKSLVVATNDEGGDARYRLLETVRTYATEKLVAAGEADAVRASHRDWYLAWLEATPVEQLTFDPASFRAVRREIDNLRAAADWCERDDRPDLLARIATRMYGMNTDTRSAGRDCRQRVGVALRDEARLTREERVSCYSALAVASWSALETERPIHEATRAIDLAAGQPSPALIFAYQARAFARSVLATAGAPLAADARRDNEQAVAIARASLPAEWRAMLEFNGWCIETNMQNARAAAAWADRARETCRSMTTAGWLDRMPFVCLAVSHHLLDEHDLAVRAALRAHAMPDVTDMPVVWRSMLTIDMAPALVAGGEVETGVGMLREAMTRVRRLGTPLAENHLLSMFAYTEHLLGRHDRAGRLLGAARHLGGAADLPVPFRTPASASMYRHYLPRVREALGPTEARRARNEGRAMTMDEALAYALVGGH